MSLAYSSISQATQLTLEHICPSNGNHLYLHPSIPTYPRLLRFGSRGKQRCCELPKLCDRSQGCTLQGRPRCRSCRYLHRCIPEQWDDGHSPLWYL